MIRIEDRRVLQAAAQTNTHQPWVIEFFQQWRNHELEKLPYSRGDLSIAQGRVQVLDELLRMFRNAEVDLERSKA